MDALEKDLARLAKEATLSQSVEDVDKILEQLVQAREAIANGQYISHQCVGHGHATPAPEPESAIPKSCNFLSTADSMNA